VHKVTAPVNGYWVPTADGIFIPGTIVPFETIQNRSEAMARLEKTGVPKEQVSYFYRNDNYHNAEMFVGRAFYPSCVARGRFGVDANGLPADFGDGGVASRPAYRDQEIVFEF
jgi:hypothetical protein